jgi:hypothetical protein
MQAVLAVYFCDNHSSKKNSTIASSGLTSLAITMSLILTLGSQIVIRTFNNVQPDAPHLHADHAQAFQPYLSSFAQDQRYISESPNGLCSGSISKDALCFPDFSR